MTVKKGDIRKFKGLLGDKYFIVLEVSPDYCTSMVIGESCIDYERTSSIENYSTLIDQGE